MRDLPMLRTIDPPPDHPFFLIRPPVKMPPPIGTYELSARARAPANI